MLQKAWHLPFRNLVLAMPLTCLLVALVTHTVTDLDWTESLLIGRAAVARPTRSSRRAWSPTRACRASFAIRSTSSRGSTTAWRCRRCSPSPRPPSRATTSPGGSSCSRTWASALATGLVLGVARRAADAAAAPARTRRRSTRSASRSPPTARRCCRPRATGSSAVFVAAIAFGIWRPDIRDCFESRSEDVLEVVKLGVFLVFGAIFTLRHAVRGRLGGRGGRGVHAAGGAAGGRVRRAGRLAPASTRPSKAFIAWFGPKGVATMTFALFVLGSSAPAAGRIVGIAALAVFVSIIAHGLTDHARRRSGWRAVPSARRLRHSSGDGDLGHRLARRSAASARGASLRRRDARDRDQPSGRRGAPGAPGARARLAGGRERRGRGRAGRANR